MLKLRKVLLYKPLFYALFFLSIVFVFYTCTHPKKSIYGKEETAFTAYLNTITFDGAVVKMELINKEKIIATYRCQNEDELKELKEELSLGQQVRLEGNLKKPKSNRNFYSFSYANYLRYQHINYLLTITKIEKLSTPIPIKYQLKNQINKHIASLGSASKYVNTFFLGNTEQVSDKAKLAFQKVGISHLFALSGTQITFLSIAFKKIFKRLHLQETSQFLLGQLLLLGYYAMIHPCAAIDRAMIFTFIFELNKTFDFHISPFCLILLALSVLFFLHPSYIYDIGFQYSTIISIGLILSGQEKRKRKFWIELLYTSGLSFLLSAPISLYHFSYLNPLSIIYNLFYVPFINYLLFPICLLTFFFPFLKDVVILLTDFLESSVYFLETIRLGLIVLPRIALIFYYIYYLPLLGYLMTNKSKLSLIIFLLCFCLHFVYNTLSQSDRLYMLDVGQGDCFLFISKRQALLLDTGGKVEYSQKQWQRQKIKVGAGRYIVQFLYQLGLTQIDSLVLSHGDDDHAKEALTLLEEVPINNIYINANALNSLEQKIAIKAKDYQTPLNKWHQDKILKLGNFTFQNLNQPYEEENASSLVLLATINKYHLLLTGDATIKVEQQILRTYHLPHIHILKAGHHGSRTSTSEALLKRIKPDITLISSGIDNKFGHPHQEVVKRLKKYGSKIYQSNQLGMVMIDFQTQKIKSS